MARSRQEVSESAVFVRACLKQFGTFMNYERQSDYAGNHFDYNTVRLLYRSIHITEIERSNIRTYQPKHR